ncbi:CBS domain-containing protein [Haloarcula marina]|uniref:CBS domain-containing protein n=1 Tax=Haloarcula marina TaxID=2961574 RepID=UPI0020B7C096|nr:CBS domain-containing protein [Halomicroarcula marina]
MVVPIIVREIMQAPVEIVSVDTPLDELAARFQSMGHGAIVVCRDEDPVGVITRMDVIGSLTTGDAIDEITAERIMSHPVITVSASAPIQMGAETLYDHDVNQALVMEGDRVVGLLRADDLAPYLPSSAVARPDESLVAEEREWEYDYDDESPPGVSVGDVVTFSKSISERDLELFAEVSGDMNRLHLDQRFAEQTRFGRRIVHGALASSVISAALSKLPGLVIYLSQTVTYSAPVEVGERVRARCEIIANLGNDRYRLEIEEVDETDTTVISGEASVLIDPAPEQE